MQVLIKIPGYSNYSWEKIASGYWGLGCFFTGNNIAVCQIGKTLSLTNYRDSNKASCSANLTEKIAR